MQSDFYHKSSHEVFNLAAGSAPTICLGMDTIKVSKLELDSIIYVKNINRTLNSVGNLCDTDSTVVFTKQEAIIWNITKLTVNTENVVKVVPRNRATGLYDFTASNTTNDQALSAKPFTDINVWHQKLTHKNVKLLKSLQENAINFGKLFGNLEPGHPCFLGKFMEKTVKSRLKQVECPGEVVLFWPDWIAALQYQRDEVYVDAHRPIHPLHSCRRNRVKEWHTESLWGI